MRVLVYHNPAAGHAQRTPESIISELQRAGHEVRWQHAADPLPDDVALEVDLIVTAGGDGSVGRAGRQLVGSGVPIATLPLGTANNLAAALGAQPDDLLARIDAWDARPFDVGVLHGLEKPTCFLEGFGAGAFADAAAALTQMGSVAPPFGVRDELARDLRRLAQVLRTCPALSVDLEVDGEPLSGDYAMVEVLNIGALGPRVHLAPKADLSDGWLDVALVPDSDRERLADVLDRCDPGRPCFSPLPTRRAQQVTITLPGGTQLHLDGKSLKAPSARIEIEVQPAALVILCGAPGAGRPEDLPTADDSAPTSLPRVPPTSSPSPRPRSPFR